MKYTTNNDKILQAVLKDADLIELGKYNPDDYLTLDSAFDSDNYVVNAVAQIIGGFIQNFTDRNIYNQVVEFLKGKV